MYVNIPKGKKKCGQFITYYSWQGIWGLRCPLCLNILYMGDSLPGTELYPLSAAVTGGEILIAGLTTWRW